MEEIVPLGTVRDSWIEELVFVNPLAVKVVVPVDESHFGLAEDERVKAVLTTPFVCHEITREKMFNEVLHGVEGGLPNDGV